jgi:hypothetical protein
MRGGCRQISDGLDGQRGTGERVCFSDVSSLTMRAVLTASPEIDLSEHTRNRGHHTVEYYDSAM